MIRDPRCDQQGYPDPRFHDLGCTCSSNQQRQDLVDLVFWVAEEIQCYGHNAQVTREDAESMLDEWREVRHVS